MPPSPSLRPSPGRELRPESTHKRGHSLGSPIPLKAKDDDLVLFNEMQNRERDNFLLHSTDDFEDSISKLKCFSEFKIGLNIPHPGESSDLLHGEREKNDYDWLLTPPDTPLFPSLDDDEPQPVNMSRGRSRTQPISISRSSMNERIPRTSRSSASPHRLSQSPRSSYIRSQSRPTTTSTRSSPPARIASPSRRPSTPPTKPATPTPRSSTPTVRRMSTGSSGPAITSGLRGTSPVKANRGNSASPKFQTWQSDLPGFSTDAPPNLRTSLSDRSSSRARGLSPASGSGKDSSSKFRRQSISPSGFRSGSSLHSGERDSFSSHSKASKASKASSGDDDVESVQSVTPGISENSYVRKYGSFANSRPTAVSNRSSRKQTASSAPKRSFDSVVRQTDQRKAPHNMFRPLLSSVPASTFYVGKTNISQRPLFSRNSSLTTSSNASSEQGASFAPEVEDSDLDQSDLNGQWEKAKYTETQEEVFVFDKLDNINEDTGNDNQGERLHGGVSINHENVTEQIDSQEIEKFAGKVADTLNANPSQSSYATRISDIECSKTMAFCSKCGKDYITNLNQENICKECAALEQLATRLEVRLASDFTRNHEELGTRSDLLKELLEQPEKESNDFAYSRYERSRITKTDFDPASPIQLLMDSMDQCSTNQKNDSPNNVYDLEANDGFETQQLSTSPGLRIDNLEGTGISVLLTQSSSSSKWPVVQGRFFSAANLLCSEPSYARDNNGAFRRSFGRDTSSASSVDLGSSKASDGRMIRQLSTKSVEMVNMRSSSDIHAKAISSHSDASTKAGELVSDNKIERRQLQSCDFGSMVNEGIQKTSFDQNLVSSYQEAGVEDSEHASSEPTFLDEDKDAGSGSSIASSGLDMQLVNQPLGHQFHDSSENNFREEDCSSCRKLSKSICHNLEGIPSEIEIPNPTPDSLVTYDNHMRHDTGVRSDVSDAATQSSSIMISEQKSSHEGTQDVQIEFTSVEKPEGDDPEECCTFSSDKDPSISSLGSKIAGFPPCEGLNVAIEAPKDLQRSFTLEEATDTILFCSSIIHDIAYKAATIGMERELKLAEAPRPTITNPGKSVSNQMDFRWGLNKRSPISRKVKKKRLETGTKIPPPLESESNLQNAEALPSKAAPPNTRVMHMVDTAKPPKLESKCNCTVM